MRTVIEDNGDVLDGTVSSRNSKIKDVKLKKPATTASAKVIVSGASISLYRFLLVNFY